MATAHHALNVLTPLVNNTVTPNPDPEGNKGAANDQQVPLVSSVEEQVKENEAKSGNNANNNSQPKKASAKIKTLSVPDSPSPGEVSATSMTTSLTQSPQSSSHQVLMAKKSSLTNSTITPEAPPPADV